MPAHDDEDVGGATMRRGLIAVIAALLAIGTVAAQEAPWRLVQSSDGTLYVIAAGTRHRIVPAAVPDDVIAAIPEGEAWETGAMTAVAPQVQPAQTQASAAAPVDAAVTLEGSGIQKSRLFRLSGGNYWIQWTATPKSASGCYHGGTLQAPDQPLVHESVGNELINDRNPRSGETRAYNLKPGDYFLNMSSGCDWRVTITPQP
jgi:hypothetical protein